MHLHQRCCLNHLQGDGGDGQMAYHYIRNLLYILKILHDKTTNLLVNHLRAGESAVSRHVVVLLSEIE